MQTVNAKKKLVNGGATKKMWVCHTKKEQEQM